MAYKSIVFCSLLAIASAGYVLPYTTKTTTTTYNAQPLHNIKIANPAVDAVARTQQNVVRTYDGTVSTYSKQIDTPYSSVHKQDTRISNNVYTPTLAKTVTYAAPATITKSYLQSAPVVYTHAAPVASVAKTISTTYHAQPTAAVYTAPVVTKTLYSPAVAKTIRYAAPAPVVTKTLYTPAVYSHSAPVAKTISYAAPVHAYAPAAAAVPVATTNINHGPAATTYTHNAPGISSYGSSQTIHYSPAEMVSHMSFDGFGTHWGF